MDQLEGDPPIGLTEVALSLARRPILTHRDRQVWLYAAQAIADVLRIYAPDAPYELVDLQVHTHRHTDRQTDRQTDTLFPLAYVCLLSTMPFGDPL